MNKKIISLTLVCFLFILIYLFNVFAVTLSEQRIIKISLTVFKDDTVIENEIVIKPGRESIYFKKGNYLLRTLDEKQDTIWEQSIDLDFIARIR